MLTGQRLAPLCRRAIRSFCDKPKTTSTNLQKDKSEPKKAKTFQKENESAAETEVEDHINPITGEIGGPKGPEPTRYGDWERKGRVSDF